MSQQHEQSSAGEAEGEVGESCQQQQQPQVEGHCGQGSESAMKHLREWEQHRAGATGARNRHGSN